MSFRTNRTYKTYGTYGTYKSRKTEYRYYRIRGHIRSFRDLEIYQQTTKLAAEVLRIEEGSQKSQSRPAQAAKRPVSTAAAEIPRLIAEAYGDKYTNDELAYQKLEDAMRAISTTISKLDFLIETLEDDETKQELAKIIRNYQVQRRKTLNLKRAWEKAAERRRNQ